MAKEATKHATKQAEAPKEQVTAVTPKQQEIAMLAYTLWEARGCPVGTPEEDWFNAKRALNAKAGA